MVLLKKTPIVQVACERSSVGRATYYRWKKDDADFAKQADEALDQSARPLGVVLRVVADVDVQGDAVQLGPGMDGEMRFGEHHGTRDAAAVERMEQITENGEA